MSEVGIEASHKFSFLALSNAGAANVHRKRVYNSELRNLIFTVSWDLLHLTRNERTER